jgi:hypothetical protein
MSLLLSRYIKHREPKTRRFHIEVLPSDDRYRNTLRKAGWRIDDGSVLIIDEAQLTYDNTGLWNAVFKPISANPERFKNRVIIFASYGSPSGTATRGTNVRIPDRQRITLSRIDHHDGTIPIGLLLDRIDFHDYMSRRHPSSRYHFDSTFLHLLYDLTIGHVGAIEDLIRVVTTHNVCPLPFASWLV